MTQAVFKTDQTTINGFDISQMESLAKELVQDPARALAAFSVQSTWAGAAAAEHRVQGYELGGASYPRKHTLRTDEPAEFLGGDTAANPQEYLFVALNACLLFGYATKAAMLGIAIEKMTVQTSGRIDVRGAMGLSPVTPGFDSISCAVTIQAQASTQQLQELHQLVLSTSPNAYNVMSAIRLAPTLIIHTPVA